MRLTTRTKHFALCAALATGLWSCSAVDPPQGEEPAPQSASVSDKTDLAAPPAGQPLANVEESKGEMEEPVTLSSAALSKEAGSSADAPSDTPLTAVADAMQKSEEKPSYNDLTEREEYILINKGTERAYTGELLENKAEGTYICRQCNAALYTSDQKFNSHCGWPSFDDNLSDAVRRETDSDGRRTEILCANCGGHLGHVFLGEGATPKNTRHCVNSVSMQFVPKGEELPAKITVEN